MRRAGDIFFTLRTRGLADRESAIKNACEGNLELENLVRLLLSGDESPLPVEALADEVRAAQETMSLDVGSTHARSSSQQGTMIGNYKLLERIGEGGFGIVYMAQQEQPVRRRVAMKIVKLGMDTKQVIARFEAERQALALMDHANIARVFDAGATATGRPYFVMELVKGLPITEYCDKHALTIHQRLELILQVCDALQHAHQRGVIHRDIKPSNVLVSTSNDKAVPKIIDFGIAKATTARLTERTVFTEFRQMIGTPEYMSPEQAGESSDDIDTRTDVYATGVLLYELLTGATPFDSKRLRSAAYGEIQRIIREEEPPRPSTRISGWGSTRPETLDTAARSRALQPTKFASTIKGELDWIVMKAIEKDRSRRYDSAGSMAADIQRYLSGYAVQAAPPDRTYLIRKFARRHKGPVIAGTLLSIALFAGLIGTSLGFFNAQRQRKVAVEEKNRADENASQARAAESLATRRAYAANMLSASSAINNVQFVSASAFLDAAPQLLRGWEWRLLHERLDTSIRALPIANRSTSDRAENYDYALLVHPDGQSIITSDDYAEPAARSWNALTGQLLHAFARPALPDTEPPLRVDASLSANGSRLWLHSRPVAQRANFVLDTWDVLLGKRIDHAEFAPPHFPGQTARLIPDASRVLFQGVDDTWRLTDMAGRVVATLGDSQLAMYRSNSPSHHGNRLVGFDRDFRIMTIHDAHSLAPAAIASLDGAMVTASTFSQDNRWLAIGGDGGFAQVFDTASNPPTSVRMPHPARVGNVAFSPDASLLATVAGDRAIRVWDSSSGTLLATYPSQRLINSPLAFFPDGKTIAGQETDGAVRFWDITAEDTRVLRGHCSIVSNAMFVPNNPGGLIASAGWDGQCGAPGALRLWDADSGALVGTLDGPPTGMIQNQQLACSRDGKFAVLAWSSPVPEQRQVVLVDLRSGQSVWRRPVPRASPTEFVAITPDASAVLLSGISPLGTVEGHGFHLNVLDPASGEVVRTRELEVRPRWAFALSPEGNAILTMPYGREKGEESEHPNTMLVLDPTTMETVRTIEDVTEPVHTLVFQRDGKQFVTCGWDGAIRLYDFASGNRLATLTGHVDPVMSAAFSPDGKRLATAGIDRMIRIWDLDTFDQVASLGGHNGHIADLDWDATGERLVSCSGDTTVRIWEPAPIRNRAAARDARKAALTVVTPLVHVWLTELREPEQVHARIAADATLTPLQRKTAWQALLAHGLAQ